MSQGRRDNSAWGFSSLGLVPRRYWSQAPKGLSLLFLLRVRAAGLRGAFLWPKVAGCLGLPESRGAKDRMQGSCVHRGDHGYVCGGNVLGLFSPLSALTGGIS